MISFCIPQAERTMFICFQIKFAGGFLVHMVAHYIAAFLTGRTFSTIEIHIRLTRERQEFTMGADRLYKEVDRSQMAAGPVICYP
jgi:hypothetical protein